MPTYDYECESCKTVVEQVHRISEKPKKSKCSCCGGKLIKLISTPTFVLKGEGWASSGYSKSSLKDTKKVPIPKKST